MTERGTTLLELLVALGVIAVAASAMAFAMLTSQHQTEEARGRVLALQAARTALETVKNTAVDDLPGIATDGLVPADLPNGNVVIETNPENPVGQELVTVTVTVTWTGPKNTPKTLRLTTMRSRY